MEEFNRYPLDEIDARIARAMAEAGLELVAESPEVGTLYEGTGIKVIVTVAAEKPKPVILSINLNNSTTTTLDRARS